MIRIAFILFLPTLLWLSGCSSLGQGIAEAILTSTTKEGEDKRVCQISGKRFKGLAPSLGDSDGKAKVLMVHGVGNHLPGYSTRLLENLTSELDLTVRERHHKNISLRGFTTDNASGKEKLGNLRIHRLLNQDHSKEMLFYELTWSEITADEKALLDYDNSDEYSYRRAAVNDLLKKFSNETGPDPMIYLGESRDAILESFTQAFCWMLVADWADLPAEGTHTCPLNRSQALEHAANDHFSVISHSLGSRITIDGMQRIAALLGKENPTGKEASESSTQMSGIKQALKNQEVTLYMLSNQLPILQLGRKLPEVTGNRKIYCKPVGKHYASRIVSETSIIAFSDPNDILSYAIPYQFAEKYLDSRLCVDITNININIAPIMDAFGLGEVANPLMAHTGYDDDERVVSLIAHGIGHEDVAPGVKENCDWTELIN